MDRVDLISCFRRDILDLHDQRDVVARIDHGASRRAGWSSDGNFFDRLNAGERFHRLAESLNCHGEYVERPADIRPALERAFASGRPAVVNVLTDWRARATTAQFAVYST